MRITFQPSSGRGEYEISENAENLGPTHILNYPISLKLGTITLDLHVHLKREGGQGKFRLRKTNQAGKWSQVQLQVADALLLPRPIRSEALMGEGEPVLQNDLFILKHIYLRRVELIGSASPDKKVMAEAALIECQNQTNKGYEIPIGTRVAQIETIWAKRGLLPLEISSLLAEHEQIVRSGGPLPQNTRGIIESLQKKVEQHSRDYEVAYAKMLDVVPALLEMVNGVIEEAPPPLEQIPLENLELRERMRERWLRYVQRRGVREERFKRAVRAAYGYQCVMCGAQFPPTKLNHNPGVDAAHIVPWSRYDLDEVHNGIALCKLHHWAFDEGLLHIVFEDGVYRVILSQDASQMLHQVSFSIDILEQVVGAIPTERLPVQLNDRPHPDLLRKRREDLA
ncbi:MAG: HNH endonuclease [Anaerolineae bacterium]|nr:HNH endonuclease [Anaerolineae bacterium]